MPFPDSEYPSILRGRDKRESQRLLNAAPSMLEALCKIHDNLLELEGWPDDPQPQQSWRSLDATTVDQLVSNSMRLAIDAIAKAEGRDE
jgi:hypothetical protein